MSINGKNGAEKIKDAHIAMKQKFHQLFSVDLQLAAQPSGHLNSSRRAARYATSLLGHLLKIWQTLESLQSDTVLVFSRSSSSLHIQAF